jgi:hypothetical protein
MMPGGSSESHATRPGGPRLTAPGNIAASSAAAAGSSSATHATGPPVMRATAMARTPSPAQMAPITGVAGSPLASPTRRKNFACMC